MVIVQGSHLLTIKPKWQSPYTITKLLLSSRSTADFLPMVTTMDRLHSTVHCYSFGTSQLCAREYYIYIKVFLLQHQLKKRVLFLTSIT